MLNLYCDIYFPSSLQFSFFLNRSNFEGLNKINQNQFFYLLKRKDQNAVWYREKKFNWPPNRLNRPVLTGFAPVYTVFSRFGRRPVLHANRTWLSSGSTCRSGPVLTTLVTTTISTKLKFQEAKCRKWNIASSWLRKRSNPVK
jgi:hypothetical protein